MGCWGWEGDLQAVAQPNCRPPYYNDPQRGGRRRTRRGTVSVSLILVQVRHQYFLCAGKSCPPASNPGGGRRMQVVGRPAFVLSPRGRACPQPPILERHAGFPNTPCSAVAGVTASFTGVPDCGRTPRSAKQSSRQSPKSYALPNIRFPCDTLTSEAGSQTKSAWQPADLPMPCFHTRSELHAQNSYFGTAGRCCNVDLRLLSRHRHDDGYDA